MEIVLEQLTRENVARALEIRRDDVPEAWVGGVPALMELTEYGAEHRLIGHTYLAGLDGRAVGVVMIGEALEWDTDPAEMKGKPFYRVMRFVVDRDFRGRGIGGEILEEAVRRVYAEFGPRSLALGVHRDNVRAARFYARHGFRPTGVFEGDDEYWLRIIG